MPVVNALSDDHHPCQALADLLTIRDRFGDLGGVRLAYLGDDNNVAHSLMEAGAIAGMDVVVAAPDGLAARRARHAARVADNNGGSVRVKPTIGRPAHTSSTPTSGSRWATRRSGAPVADLSALPGDAELMARARPDAIFMHCLPAHRGQEVAAAVIDGAQSPSGPKRRTGCRRSRRCCTRWSPGPEGD